MGYGNNIFCLVGDLVQQIAKVKELANMFLHHKFQKNSNDEHLWTYETNFWTFDM
jgi:hypothetical protein